MGKKIKRIHLFNRIVVYSRGHLCSFSFRESTEWNGPLVHKFFLIVEMSSSSFVFIYIDLLPLYEEYFNLTKSQPLSIYVVECNAALQLARTRSILSVQRVTSDSLSTKLRIYTEYIPQ